MTIKVRINTPYFGGESVVAYERGTYFEWDSDGYLSVRDAEGEVVAVHHRGTWTAAEVVA